MASKFFQPLSDHAAIGPYLAERIQSDKCWWCGSGERQSCHRFFVKCRAWSVQIKKLWRSVRKACERKHPRRQLSDCYSRTRERPRWFWLPCGIQRPGGW